MKIGDIELAIVSDIENREQAEVDELKDGFKNIDVTPVKHQSSVETLVISGFMNKEVHSSNLSISEQKNRLKRLRKRNVQENSIDYKEYTGYILVESINFTDNSDSKIINEVEIETRYFPWPKYYPSKEPL